MADTAKIVSPDKIVLLPNIQAGCYLADTADEDDVADKIKELQREYPDLGVVCYVNTTAVIKSMCDAVCTSSNAVDVVKGLPNQEILFIPDKNLARYVADKVPTKKIIPWDGYCDVHEDLEPANIEKLQNIHPEMKVLVHPECRDDVISIADEVMSTSGMVSFAKKDEAKKYLAVTECDLSDLLAIQVPDKQFYRACNVCRFMKMITLENVIESLENLQPQIDVPVDVRVKAERSIRKMFELTSPDKIPAALQKKLNV